MAHNLSENMKTMNALVLLKEFDDKQTYVKYCPQAPAITASCDRLKKCWTQIIESCFSAGHVVQHVIKPD